MQGGKGDEYRQCRVKKEGDAGWDAAFNRRANQLRTVINFRGERENKPS